MTREDDAVVEERLRATYAAITRRTSYSSPPRLPMMVEALHDEPRPSVRRSWNRVAVAAAVAAALVIATLVLVRTESDDGGTVLTPAGTAPSAPAPAPSTQAPTPLGAPLVVGPDAASTLLTSWGSGQVDVAGQFHGGMYVFVYADGRVIWDLGGASVWADADGRVTAIPFGGPTEFGRFWLTESGVKPASGTPGGELVCCNMERRLSARGLELVRGEHRERAVHRSRRAVAGGAPPTPRGPEPVAGRVSALASP